MQGYWELPKNTAQYVMVGPFLNILDLSLNTTAWAGLTGETIAATTTDGSGAPANISLSNTPVVSADGVQRYIELTAAETNHDAMQICMTANEIEPQVVFIKFT